jgi:hypothetical protein
VLLLGGSLLSAPLQSQTGPPEAKPPQEAQQRNANHAAMDKIAIDSGVSLRGGVYDLNANPAGTLEIPLSAVLTSPITTSSR